MSKFECTSICKVVSDNHDNTDNLKLFRLADVVNGEIKLFMKDKNSPRTFKNRSKLYKYDGPDEIGYIGAWDWSARPKDNGSEGDYVQASFNTNVRLIELKELPECTNLDELACDITSYKFYRCYGKEILCVLPNKNGIISGLMCDKKFFVKEHGFFILKNTIYKLPKLSINESDVITIAGLRFYKYTDVHQTMTYQKVRDPIEIIKGIIISRVESAYLCKSISSSTNTEQLITFLKELPTCSLVQEISKLLDCSDEESQSYINQYIKRFESYLNGIDIDVFLAHASLDRVPGLVDKCKKLVHEDWKIENESILKQANNQLDEVKFKLSKYESRIEEYTELQAKLNQINEEIQAKNQILSDLDQKVAERIAMAKNNISDFLCEMAFATSFCAKPSTTDPTTFTNLKVLHRPGAKESAEKIEDLDSFIEALSDNLEITGYNENYAYDMSEVITFCISHNLPLIINENAEIIADSIAAMFGKYGVMQLSLSLASQNCSALTQTLIDNAHNEYNIFVISGIFDGFSLNAFNELLQNYSEISDKSLLILSVRGLTMNMIPVAVWNRAFFIDGDLFLKSVMTEELTRYSTEKIFQLPSYKEKIKQKQKELKPFRDLVSNTAQLNYAKFMSLFDVNLKSNILLCLQLTMASLNNNSSENLIEAFSSAEVDEDVHKLISKYL